MISEESSSRMVMSSCIVVRCWCVHGALKNSHLVLNDPLFMYRRGQSRVVRSRKKGEENWSSCFSIDNSSPRRRKTTRSVQGALVNNGESRGPEIFVNEQNLRRNKKCLRCGKLFRDDENSSTACHYHGHMTGDRGLYSVAPPHQGVDGIWSEASGVIVYKWNKEEERPNTGRKNWKRRWSCCDVYEEDAPPCQSGWHATYDDGATLF